MFQVSREAHVAALVSEGDGRGMSPEAQRRDWVVQGFPVLGRTGCAPGDVGAAGRSEQRAGGQTYVSCGDKAVRDRTKAERLWQ